MPTVAPAQPLSLQCRPIRRILKRVLLGGTRKTTPTFDEYTHSHVTVTCMIIKLLTGTLSIAGTTHTVKTAFCNLMVKDHLVFMTETSFMNDFVQKSIRGE